MIASAQIYFYRFLYRCVEYAAAVGYLIGVFLMLAVLTLQQPVYAEVSQRIDAVHTLLEKSSAASRVAKSENNEVKTLYENARKLYSQARKAFEDGDSDQTILRLNQAVAEMTRAVQLAGSGEGKLKKREDAYQERLNSIESLLAAFERIIEEKSMNDSAGISHAVRHHIDQASASIAGGDVLKARQQLDAGYQLVTNALEELRQGETLVRSLNFASMEEEFIYEIDRNDTHKMLIEVLVSEKAKSNQMASAFIEKATALRIEAEKYSTKGNFELAIKAIEESTQNLVRAIRSSGVYIPG